jgi:hypothetical protein
MFPAELHYAVTEVADHRNLISNTARSAVINRARRQRYQNLNALQGRNPFASDPGACRTVRLRAAHQTSLEMRTSGSVAR